MWRREMTMPPRDMVHSQNAWQGRTVIMARPDTWLRPGTQWFGGPREEYRAQQGNWPPRWSATAQNTAFLLRLDYNISWSMLRLRTWCWIFRSEVEMCTAWWLTSEASDIAKQNAALLNHSSCLPDNAIGRGTDLTWPDLTWPLGRKWKWRQMIRSEDRAFIIVKCSQSSVHPVLVSCPHGLTVTWWGCCGSCLWHEPTELAHSSLFCSCACFYLYCLFNCISFRKFSQQLSAFSPCSCGLISALLVLSTIYLFKK